jgi:hypothetical protein
MSTEKEFTTVTKEPKSQSKRLRDVLYLLYTQDNGGYATFDEYYDYSMEKIIDNYKSLLK